MYCRLLEEVVECCMRANEGTPKGSLILPPFHIGLFTGYSPIDFFATYTPSKARSQGGMGDVSPRGMYPPGLGCFLPSFIFCLKYIVLIYIFYMLYGRAIEKSTTKKGNKK